MSKLVASFILGLLECNLANNSNAAGAFHVRFTPTLSYLIWPMLQCNIFLRRNKFFPSLLAHRGQSHVALHNDACGLVGGKSGILFI